MTRKAKRKAQKKTQNLCKEIKNPIKRWFCGTRFAKEFIYEPEEGLDEGLVRGLDERAGLAFYFTLFWSFMLMIFVFMKQFNVIGFVFPPVASHIYIGFLLWFVVANELDKWRTLKTEKRIFRRGMYIVGTWFFVAVVSVLINAFMNKPVPEELELILSGVLSGLVVSGISTFFKHKECKDGQKYLGSKK